MQVKTPSLEAPEWERRICQYAALAEQVAEHGRHLDVGCVRVDPEEVAAAAAQHAQEWVQVLLEAMHSQEAVQMQACSSPSQAYHRW